MGVRERCTCSSRPTPQAHTRAGIAQQGLQQPCGLALQGTAAAHRTHAFHARPHLQAFATYMSILGMNSNHVASICSVGEIYKAKGMLQVRRRAPHTGAVSQPSARAGRDGMLKGASSLCAMTSRAKTSASSRLGLQLLPSPPSSKESLAAYTRALELAPDDASLRTALAAVLTDLGTKAKTAGGLLLLCCCCCCVVLLLCCRDVMLWRLLGMEAPRREGDDSACRGEGPVKEDESKKRRCKKGKKGCALLAVCFTSLGGPTSMA